MRRVFYFQILGFMYGNLNPGEVAHEIIGNPSSIPSVGSSSVSSMTKKSIITWELLILLTSEFLVFSLLLTPLIPDNSTTRDIESFWTSYTLLAFAACAPYILLTAPVAAGYTWIIQKWPWNMIVWIIVVLSLGSVVHISSVRTDPRGVFVGLCSISSYLLFLTVLVYYRAIFFKRPTAFAIGIVWQICVFLPIYFVQGLTLYSCIGSGISSVICCTFFAAELRLIENETVVLGYLDTNDPFSVCIWINCASWRFFIQMFILFNKILLQLILAILRGFLKVGKFIITKFVQITPSRWFTPKTAQKVVNIASGV